MGKLAATIAPKPLNVTADQKEKYVGDADPELTYRSDMLEYGDEMTGKLTRDKGEKAGKYRITLGTLTAGKNYDIVFTGNWLVIKDRAKPTVKPTAKPTAKPTVKPESDYKLLAKMEADANDDTALVLSWTKVQGASGYDVFFARSDDFEFDLYMVAHSSTTRIRIPHLKKGTTYKACVKAWKGKRYFGDTSPCVHAIAGGYNKRYCNTKSVQVERSKVTLKVGRTSKIKARVYGVRRDRMLVNRENDLRYYSSNIHVATVSETGRIKATGTGSCRIYAMANNGARASVKVTVK